MRSRGARRVPGRRVSIVCVRGTRSAVVPVEDSYPNKPRYAISFRHGPRRRSTSRRPSSRPAISPRRSPSSSAGLERDDRFQTLLGVTGSGKTMTMANVIAQYGKPTLVLSHNKTLAAQLYGEIKSFFPTQRGRVLHLVLRLLPAGSVRPDDRHVHREGRVDQRGHRPPAPARDVVAHGARRRHHRRDGQRDLRPGRPGVVPRADGHAHAGAEGQSRRHPALAGEDPVQPQRRRVRARHASACAATRSRSFRRTRSRACASSCGATRSSASPRSTCSPARRSPRSSARRSIPRSISSRSARRSSAR